MKRSFVN